MYEKNDMFCVHVENRIFCVCAIKLDAGRPSSVKSTIAPITSTSSAPSSSTTHDPTKFQESPDDGGKSNSHPELMCLSIDEFNHTSMHTKITHTENKVIKVVTRKIHILV